MARDPFGSYVPGEVPFPLPAALLNTMVRGADAFRRSFLGAQGAGDIEDPLHPALTCYVRNRTGAVLPERSVLAYSTPLVLPADDPLGVQGRPAFDGIAPADATAPFVVVRESLEGWMIGEATAAGLAVVRLDVTDGTHTRAVPVAGVTDHLASAAAGGVPVIWKEAAGSGSGSGSALRWAVVLLGDQACCTSPPPPKPKPVTAAHPCSGSGSGAACVGWGVMYDCDDQANLNKDILDFDVYHYDPVGHNVPDECGGTNSAVAGFTGAAAEAFLKDNTVCEYVWCCPAFFPAGPVRIAATACVTLSNGTGAYSSLVATTAAASWDGLGYPISFTDGTLTVKGKLRIDQTRTPPGYYFSGTITSTGAGSGSYTCGCDTTIPAGSADANGISQAVVVGPVVTGNTAPQEVLRVTTPCGSLDIRLAVCPTFNCVAGVCTDPGDGTGTYATLAACTAAGCGPPPAASCCPATFPVNPAPSTLAVPSGVCAGTYSGSTSKGGGASQIGPFTLGGGSVFLICYDSDTPIQTAGGPATASAGQWYVFVNDGNATGKPIVSGPVAAAGVDCGSATRPIVITGSAGSGAICGGTFSFTATV